MLIFSWAISPSVMFFTVEMVPFGPSSLLFENPSTETSLTKRGKVSGSGSFPEDTDPRAETQPGRTVATQGPKHRNSLPYLSKVPVLWTHVSFSLCTDRCFPVLCTHSYFPVLCTHPLFPFLCTHSLSPYSLHMACLTLFSTHSCFFLCPLDTRVCSCLQSILRCESMPHCFSQAVCFNGDPWQALLQQPTVPRAHHSSPCPRQAQERAFKPHIGLSFKACSLKSTNFFPPKCRLWSPASAPSSDSVHRKSVVQHA